MRFLFHRSFLFTRYDASRFAPCRPPPPMIKRIERMKNYCCTSNMHSPVATLKRVPSAQVCRNAWKEFSRYIFDIDKFIYCCVFELSELSSMCSSHPALAGADKVHVALVGVFVDAHCLPTAVKALQRIVALGTLGMLRQQIETKNIIHDQVCD